MAHARAKFKVFCVVESGVVTTSLPTLDCSNKPCLWAFFHQKSQLKGWLNFRLKLPRVTYACCKLVPSLLVCPVDYEDLLSKSYRHRRLRTWQMTSFNVKTKKLREASRHGWGAETRHHTDASTNQAMSSKLAVPTEP